MPARAAYAAIVAGSETRGLGKTAYVMQLMRNDVELKKFVTGISKTCSASECDVAQKILSIHQARIVRCAGDEGAAKDKVHAFLRPLRIRFASALPVAALVVPHHDLGPRTFHGWLRAQPSGERMCVISVTGVPRRLQGCPNSRRIWQQ